MRLVVRTIFDLGSFVLDYSRELVESGSGSKTANIYVEPRLYKKMLEHGSRVCVYPLQHFMQWGTPKDLEECLTIGQMFFDQLTSSSDKEQLLRMQLGFSFSRAQVRGLQERGYTTPKPLIKVSGSPMIDQCVLSSPTTGSCLFVLRRDLPNVDAIVEHLKCLSIDPQFVVLDALSDGQAVSALRGVEVLPLNESVTIAACDAALLYDDCALQTNVLRDEGTDVVVWGVRDYPYAHYNSSSYGWITSKSDDVLSVKVKPKAGALEGGGVCGRRKLFLLSVQVICNVALRLL